MLASFGTVLNFDAIINRLDFTYSDKRPIHVIEQELGTLRQGGLSLLQYYDEVEKKLTLLTNKVNMSYEPALAKGLCEKFRDDALRVFISGLKRSLTDVLFAAKPRDLPSALALAQEVESNHKRYTFAANFARSLEDKERKPHAKAQGHQQERHSQQAETQASGTKNPHFSKQSKAPMQTDQRSSRQHNNNGAPVPMEVDPSFLRVLQPTQASAYANRKHPASDRTGGQRNQQRLNHVTQDAGQGAEAYADAASSAAAQINGDASYDSDALNFLGVNPCYPSSDEE